MNAVKIHGENWNKVSETILHRSAKQCKDRFLNYVCSNRKATPWSAAEDRKLLHLVATHGNAWTQLAKQLPGRTVTTVKRRYKQEISLWDNEKRTAQLALYEADESLSAPSSPTHLYPSPEPSQPVTLPNPLDMSFPPKILVLPPQHRPQIPPYIPEVKLEEMYYEDGEALNQSTYEPSSTHPAYDYAFELKTSPNQSLQEPGMFDPHGTNLPNVDSILFCQESLPVRYFMDHSGL